MWEEEEPKKTSRKWTTDNLMHVSELMRLEKLGGSIKGHSCCRLLNVSVRKAAETIALAVPPAVAVLRTRAAGETHLSFSFHIALLHQVHRLSQPPQHAT